MSSGNTKTNWLNQYTQFFNRTTTLTPKELEEWHKNLPAQPLNTNNQNLLPISIKIAAQTIGLDLVTVKPMSGPIGSLIYPDFTYETPEMIRKKKQQIRREKMENLNNIIRKEIRKDKLEYIEGILQKIIK